MTGKNVAARIIKLEARRQRPNEILLVWRRPDADVKAAASAAKFAPGDRIICLEWFGDGTLTEPRWCRGRLSSELGPIESEYLDRCIRRSMDRECPRDPGFAAVSPLPANRVSELADNDLLHMIFGVKT